MILKKYFLISLLPLSILGAATAPEDEFMEKVRQAKNYDDVKIVRCVYDIGIAKKTFSSWVDEKGSLFLKECSRPIYASWSALNGHSIIFKNNTSWALELSGLHKKTDGTWEPFTQAIPPENELAAGAANDLGRFFLVKAKPKTWIPGAGALYPTYLLTTHYLRASYRYSQWEDDFYKEDLRLGKTHERSKKILITISSGPQYVGYEIKVTHEREKSSSKHRNVMDSVEDKIRKAAWEGIDFSTLLTEEERQYLLQQGWNI